MTPSEMQERVEHLREDANVLFAIASEPGQTPVHPSGVVERELEEGIEDANEDRFVRPDADFEF
ncbi:hypothetical protein [Halobacterium zhouii]|uniref:hypothetical protein n=1 Tax=Halobacterium zhouii TaxID=2902624 RepID=UPI001E5C23AF|nr:hypothetical protein [Halobacterium zhouii]